MDMHDYKGILQDNNITFVDEKNIVKLTFETSIACQACMKK